MPEADENYFAHPWAVSHPYSRVLRREQAVLLAESRLKVLQHFLEGFRRIYRLLFDTSQLRTEFR